MSLLTDLINKKITFSQFVSQAEAWVVKTAGSNPVAIAASGEVLSDLKQAASNAVALADTSLGALIAPAGLAVEAAINGVLTKAIGTGATALTPAIDNAIDTATAALKAELDAYAAKLRASLTPAVTAAPFTGTSVASASAANSIQNNAA